MVSISVCYLFYQQMDEKDKTWTLRFPPKKTLIWRRHCSIDQSCCSMTSKRFLESSSGMKFIQPSVHLTNQARCICIHSINQSNGFISVRLLFLFCSRVFISRSYEIIALKFKPNLASLHKSNGVIFTPDFSNLTITQTDLLSKLIGGCKNADSTVCELKVN